ncbi:hypothetical protein [Agaribacter flavus]|uniref:Uncharacterized protein n=1 Tax=Agaribacter flavus TaxID=1902781 RepID=A0ABV7FNP4_9ALTE
MHGPTGKSFFTKSITDLVESICSSDASYQSLFKQAEHYFKNAEKEKVELTSLKRELTELKASTTSLETSENVEKLKALEHSFKALIHERNKARLARLSSVNQVCQNLLQLSEGDNWDKTQINSARVLGTLQLMSPCEGKSLRKLHQRFKPLYKAVVACRLLDKLLFDGDFNNEYVVNKFEPEQRYSGIEGEMTPFQQEIVAPVVLAAIFQDVGLLHPDAQKILKGEDGSLDEFRVLNVEERKALLKINYERTLDYITLGLGKDQYIGNSKDEKSQFEKEQQQRLAFTRTLLIKALNPEGGIGNLIKIPQIYTSIVFSSKPNFDYMDLSKAATVVLNAAEKGAVSKMVANKLLDIVGHFPQGFGITYIPADTKQVDSYEYAIVTGLNPSDPHEPLCRIATKKLTFIATGSVFTVGKQSNLYFKVAKKRLETIKPERLNEILQKLVSNFEERKTLDLIPSYWNPHEFFSYTRLQNLWKKS